MMYRTMKDRLAVGEPEHGDAFVEVDDDQNRWAWRWGEDDRWHRYPEPGPSTDINAFIDWLHSPVAA